MKLIFGSILTSIILLSCNPSSPNKISLEDEVRITEAAFESMVAQRGMAEAFYHFAAKDGVINRNDSIIAGKESIKNYFLNSPSSDFTLTWKPDYIDVANSGDLAYTFGKYVFEQKDSTGDVQKSTGIFHTVWKKQSDGSWKYVWD